MVQITNLKPEELKTILGEGFCDDCQALLDDRVNEIQVAGKGNDISPSKEDTVNSITPDEKSSVSSIAPLQNGSSSSRSVTKVLSVAENGLSENGKEKIEKSQIMRKKDFVHIERVNNKPTNVVQGLELYTGVFNEEQKEIVECVYDFQRKGQKKLLKARTYSEPTKWKRGKGGATLQFDYAEGRRGNPPGIPTPEEFDPLPHPLQVMIEKLMSWHILPPTCVPNRCIVKIYDIGDYVPPDIYHPDFLRPFCTVSFKSECKMLFGSNLKSGEISAPISIPLPVGSVLILKGNSADIAKQYVPSMPGKRISVTFGKTDDSKLPSRSSPDPDLQSNSPAQPLSQQE